MTATDPVQQQIDSLVKGHDVVLFMKGTRTFPQCGFSATVVNVLGELVDEFETVNVLADPNIRAGIKVYSDWPTIPQLYVKGEFVGGSDIVRQLYATGELQALLGVPVEEVAPPTIHVADAAAEVLRKAAAGEPHPSLRLQIGPRFQYGLSFGPEQPGDFVVETAGLKLLLDRGSAKRGDGLTLDYNDQAGGFRIDNPNEPPGVAQISVQQLKEALEADPELRLYDVRTEDERAIGVIPGSVHYTPALQQEAMKLPKDTPLYFTCHTGRRSQVAAEAFLRAGFTKLHNVAGGIDAWSREIDPNVPLY